MVKEKSIAPQVGRQSDFMSANADIVIYGGAAGSGKTMALLLEPLRHQKNGKFRASIFRRTAPQIKNPGGLWDEARKLYGPISELRDGPMEVVFPSGMRIKFSHMQYERDKYNYDGAQIALLCFDELQHFSESQFRYLLSRNRSDCGVHAYVRCTCNPPYDPQGTHWLRKYVDWWIGKDGLPNQERYLKTRWFIVVDDEFIFENSKEALQEKYGEDCAPKSLLFIPANIYDNRILLDKDPGYIASLKSLPKVERKRLLEGNWNVVIQTGDWFNRDWVQIVDSVSFGRFLLNKIQKHHFYKRYK